MKKHKELQYKTERTRLAKLCRGHNFTNGDKRIAIDLSAERLGVNPRTFNHIVHHVAGVTHNEK